MTVTGRDSPPLGDLTHSVVPAPLRTVVIRACDRPAQLGALLETLAGYEDRYGARRSYVVLDDSRDAANARHNAALLATFAQRTGAPTCHIDDARWAALVERFAGAVPDAGPALRFAVARRDADHVRPGFGKGFNLAALLGAGARYVSLDEDNLLPLRRPQDAADGLEPVRLAKAPTRFFPDVDSALAAGVELDDDPFEDALDVCGHLAPDARIVTVTHGHRGNSCSQTSHWMYLLEGECREESWGLDEARYRRNLEGESVWHGPPRAFVQPYANFTPFAIDAARMLPPTMPDGRSEDLLFGLLISLAEPASVALHSNRTLGHRQEGARARTALLHEPTMPVFNLFVAELFGAVAPDPGTNDPSGTFARVAGHLRHTAAASQRDRVELMYDHVQRVRSELVRHLEAALEAAPHAPGYWVTDLLSIVEVNRRALREPPPLRFLDWTDPPPRAEAAARMRERLEAFATVLEGWPTLWEHASREGGDLLGGS
jgi:hypothetical protein